MSQMVQIVFTTGLATQIRWSAAQGPKVAMQNVTIKQESTEKQSQPIQTPATTVSSPTATRHQVGTIPAVQPLRRTAIPGRIPSSQDSFSLYDLSPVTTSQHVRTPVTTRLDDAYKRRRRATCSLSS
jgi:hypothetical protein